MKNIFEQLHDFGLVPVIKITNVENAVPLARALCDGGLNCAEITFRTACAKDAIKAITDAGIEYISGKFLDALSDGNYAGAFNAYIKYVDEFIVQAKTGEPYDVGNMPKEPYSLGFSLVVSLAIGFLISLIVNTVWKSSLKSVELQTRASDYLKQDSLSITDSRDFFLYRKLDRVEKSDNDSRGGSTTHKSSSGNTYGGGGGKF